MLKLFSCKTVHRVYLRSSYTTKRFLLQIHDSEITVHYTSKLAITNVADIESVLQPKYMITMVGFVVKNTIKLM